MNQIGHDNEFPELCQQLGGRGIFSALALGLDFSQVAVDLEVLRRG